MDSNKREIFDNSESNFEKWNESSVKDVMIYFDRISKEIKKQSAKLGLSLKKYGQHSLNEVENLVIPLLGRFCEFFSGLACSRSLEFKEWKPVGAICFHITNETPFIMLARNILCALASGNIVFVVAYEFLEDLPGFIFVNICNDSGLPHGVLNGVSYADVYETFTREINSTDILPFKFKYLFQKSLEIKSNSAIIFDSADIDSAIQCIIDDLKFGNGQTPSSLSRVLIQQSIYDNVLAKLKAKLKMLPTCYEITDSKTKTLIKEFTESGGEVFRVNDFDSSPSLLLDVPPVSKSFQEFLKGPVLGLSSFRTSKESIALANNGRMSDNVSIFTEKMCLANEIASGLTAPSVFINCHKVLEPYCYDAELCSDVATGVTGYNSYMRPSTLSYWFRRGYTLDFMKKHLPSDGKVSAEELSENFEKYIDEIMPIAYYGQSSSLEKVGDINFSIYFGGSFKSPSSGRYYVHPVDGHKIDMLDRSDLMSAIDCASKTQKIWFKKSPLQRSKVILDFAESSCKEKIFENSPEQPVDPIWPAVCFSGLQGGVFELSPHYRVVRKVEPLGVIAVIMSDIYWSCLEDVIASVISHGNAVVVGLVGPCPAASIRALASAIEKAGIPAGLVNILGGLDGNLVNSIICHPTVDAVWLFLPIGEVFEQIAQTKNKKLWLIDNNDWWTPKADKHSIVRHYCTSTKAIWTTCGDSFGN